MVGCEAGNEDGENERVWDSGFHGEQVGGKGKKMKNVS